MTKRNKLFITHLTRSTERSPTLPSSISTISMIYVVIRGGSVASNIRYEIWADISHATRNRKCTVSGEVCISICNRES